MSLQNPGSSFLFFFYFFFKRQNIIRSCHEALVSLARSVSFFIQLHNLECVVPFILQQFARDNNVLFIIVWHIAHFDAVEFRLDVTEHQRGESSVSKQSFSHQHLSLIFSLSLLPKEHKF